MPTEVEEHRTAALLTWVPAIGFGLPAVYGAWYLHDRGHVWTLIGFPAYGDGPFEAVGVRTTVPLLLAFALVGIAEGVVGWLLWKGRRTAPQLAVVLLPFEFVFWIGFALPFGPVLGVARTLVIGFGRRGHGNTGRRGSSQRLGRRPEGVS